jgi:hypothetical protein
MEDVHGDAWAARIRADHERLGPKCPCGNAEHEPCSQCEYIAANGGFGPPHNASPKCESGRHSHCTCDTCF